MRLQQSIETYSRVPEASQECLSAISQGRNRLFAAARIFSSDAMTRACMERGYWVLPEHSPRDLYTLWMQRSIHPRNPSYSFCGRYEDVSADWKF